MKTPTHASGKLEMPLQATCRVMGAELTKHTSLNLLHSKSKPSRHFVICTTGPALPFPLSFGGLATTGSSEAPPCIRRKPRCHARHSPAIRAAWSWTRAAIYRTLTTRSIELYFLSPTYGGENADGVFGLNGDLTPTPSHSIRHHRKVHHSLLRSIAHDIEFRSDTLDPPDHSAGPLSQRARRLSAHEQRSFATESSEELAWVCIIPGKSHTVMRV